MPARRVFNLDDGDAMSGPQVCAGLVVSFVAGLYVPWLWQRRPRRRRFTEYVRVLDDYVPPSSFPRPFDRGRR